MSHIASIETGSHVYVKYHYVFCHNYEPMKFIDRQKELQRLNRALDDARRSSPGSPAFIALWGRRRVGKSRLLVEWCRQVEGLYTVAEQTSAKIQRAYCATAIAARFPGFADVEYPDWRSLLDRLATEAERCAWHGPVILDELPNLVAADLSLASSLQNWVDQAKDRPCLAVSGSSTQMMRGAVLDAGAPLFGRASQAFALRPLEAGHLGEIFPLASDRWLVSAYAVWGGIPKYWELAEPLGEDLEAALDWLVLDPSGPLHHEPERLLREEVPPAAYLRPLLDVIGNGAHRLSEIAGRLEKPATSLSRALAHLQDIGFVHREVPFGSSPASGKRSLYRVDDEFLRLWFRVVAPNRAALASVPRGTRIEIWKRHRASLEAEAWESLCRQAVPRLNASDSSLAELGPWGGAQRFWQGRLPEIDLVARSVDGRRLLVGEAKWSSQVDKHARHLGARDLSHVPGFDSHEIVRALFVPDVSTEDRAIDGVHLVDAGTVLRSLRH